MKDLMEELKGLMDGAIERGDIHFNKRDNGNGETAFMLGVNSESSGAYRIASIVGQIMSEGSHDEKRDLHEYLDGLHTSNPDLILDKDIVDDINRKDGKSSHIKSFIDRILSGGMDKNLSSHIEDEVKRRLKISRVAEILQEELGSF